MIEYFTDPLLRAPMIGSMLICITSSLVGVFVYLARRSLIGETLSHATYPGVVIGALIVALFSLDRFAPIIVITTAFFAALSGIFVLRFLERRGVHQDSALLFVLSSFFGMGLLLASGMQKEYGMWYNRVQEFIFGQTATLTDSAIWTTTGICVFTLFLLVVFYKEIKLVLFDRTYAKAIGLPVRAIDFLLLGLIVLCVIVGIQSIGIILMSGMLIIPPLLARMYTNRLAKMLILSVFFAFISALLGNIISFDGSLYFLSGGAFPTGPTILLVSAFCCACSLVFAPKSGLLARWIRASSFKRRCLLENILKAIWKAEGYQMPIQQLQKSFSLNCTLLAILLFSLRRQGYLEKNKCQLTMDGVKKAAHLIRLHRMWEVYLAKELDVQNKTVHLNAEEMEHILSKDLEQELEEFVSDATQDPHKQLIPTKEMTL
jgi:manganese/zinc/iron transport system permease protein